MAFIRVHKHYTTESGVQGPPYIINVNDIQQISPAFGGSMIRYRARIFHAEESYDTLKAKLSDNKNFIEVHDWLRTDETGRHTPVLINAEDIVSIRLRENDSPELLISSTTLTFVDEMGEVTLHVEESSKCLVDMLTDVTKII